MFPLKQIKYLVFIKSHIKLTRLGSMNKKKKILQFNQKFKPIYLFFFYNEQIPPTQILSILTCNNYNPGG